MNKEKISKELESFKETHRNDLYKNLTFSIILVRPEHSGNIGSIARIMKNFNFEKLICFNPIENPDSIKSHKTNGFAMHGKEILSNAQIITIKNQEDHIREFNKFIKKFDLVIATTAKGKRYTNIKRLAIFPDDLVMPVSKKPLNIAILFGKESRGLTNEEINLADILIRIPTGDIYPTLNLSHACGIILYEIFKKINVLNIGRGEKPVLLADKKDRRLLYSYIEKIIKKLNVRQYKEENMFLAFKNIFERSIMSKKELRLTTGVFSKLDSILNNIDLYKK
ncbi:MAG: RNA methyltransferase [Promethearchaeota archaeon]